MPRAGGGDAVAAAKPSRSGTTKDQVVAVFAPLSRCIGAVIGWLRARAHAGRYAIFDNASTGVTGPSRRTVATRLSARRPATGIATESLDDLLLSLFADDGDAYAVLDGCAAEDLPQRLRVAHAEFWCLLSDGLDPVLTGCAPYLVRLRPDAAAVIDLLHVVWGRRSGIVLCAPPGSDGWTLREHLRHSLRVVGQDGCTRFFRFYDPNVLRAMLPEMTTHSRDAFLAPFRRLYVEDVSSRGLIEFSGGGMAGGRVLDDTRACIPQHRVAGQRKRA